MPAYCRCRCHSVQQGNLHDALQRGDVPAMEYWRHDPTLDLPPLVDIRDQLESCVATGCTCMTYHVALPRRPSFKPPTQWQPGDDE